MSDKVTLEPGQLRKSWFRLFKKSIQPIYGKGIGLRFPPLLKCYLFLTHLFSPRIVLAEVHGIKMYLDSRCTFTPGLVMTGTFDKGTTKLFGKLIKPGMVVLDIGANVGYYSLFAARLAGEKGRIFSFEPAPDNFALLVRNIEVNGFKNIVPLQQAVSNKTGKGTLFLSKETDLHHLGTPDENGTISVVTVTVDEFVKKTGCRVDMIKIDVEGWEMAVLQGMVETIKRYPDLKVITEYFPSSIKESGFSAERFLQKLVDLGFKLHITDEDNETTKPTDARSILENPPKWAVNLYCERQG